MKGRPGAASDNLLSDCIKKRDFGLLSVDARNRMINGNRRDPLNVNVKFVRVSVFLVGCELRPVRAPRAGVA